MNYGMWIAEVAAFVHAFVFQLIVLTAQNDPLIKVASVAGKRNNQW